jgi:uncharacterized membrane protein YfcA
MTEPPKGPGFTDTVRRKVERMARSRQAAPSFWRHLAHVGVLGWVFVLPVVFGAMLGRLLVHSTGRKALGLAPLLLGVLVGAYGVFRQVRGSWQASDEDPKP